MSEDNVEKMAVEEETPAVATTETSAPVAEAPVTETTTTEAETPAAEQQKPETDEVKKESNVEEMKTDADDNKPSGEVDASADAKETTVPKDADAAAAAAPVSIDENVEKIIDNEAEAANAKKTKVDLQSLPIRAYLDQTIVPVLLQGMSVVAKERPPNPIEYLAAYLLKNKDKFDN
jgi:protein dpy-30